MPLVSDHDMPQDDRRLLLRDITVTQVLLRYLRAVMTSVGFLPLEWGQI